MKIKIVFWISNYQRKRNSPSFNWSTGKGGKNIKSSWCELSVGVVSALEIPARYRFVSILRSTIVPATWPLGRNPTLVVSTFRRQQKLISRRDSQDIVDAKKPGCIEQIFNSAFPYVLSFPCQVKIFASYLPHNLQTLSHKSTETVLKKLRINMKK